MEDVHYYLKHHPAPLFCFSPDSNFPLCNGEKGICHGRIVSQPLEGNLLQLHGGVAANAIPDKAQALVRAEKLASSEWVEACEEKPGIWQLTARGIGGHASMPDGTVNAVGKLVEYLLENRVGSEAEEGFLRLLELLHRDTAGGEIGVAADDGLFQPLTIIGSVISLENGRITQVFDSRYPTNMSGEKLAAGILEKAQGAAEVLIDTDKAPFYMSLDNPAVQVCIRAYNEITGEQAQPYTIGGGTYAREFPNAVSFGPEHRERPQPDFAGPIHGVDEAACKEWLLEALKIYIFALLELEKLDFS